MKVHTGIKWFKRRYELRTIQYGQNNNEFYHLFKITFTCKKVHHIRKIEVTKF